LRWRYVFWAPFPFVPVLIKLTYSTAVGPLLGAAFVPLAKEWEVSLTNFITGAQGGVIAAIAVGSLLFNALAVKYGKRPVYLITSVGLAVTCFWAAEARSFKSFVAARVLQGLCMAPMEALIPASIADIWFVHERGYRTAIFNLGVLGGINLATPIGKFFSSRSRFLILSDHPIAGAIMEASNWRVVMHAMGGAFVLQLILTFFFMPESAYHRTGTLNIDTGKHNVETDKSVAADHMENSNEKGATATPAPVDSASEPKLSFAREMLPYSGYVNHVSLLSTMVRPFLLLASPAVLWATLLFTTCISWLVGISITISQIFSAPPYNFSVRSVGATNLSSFVASLIGTAVAGPAIDGIVKRMSKRNKGIFEPEFRLPIMVTYLCFTATGFFGWGQAAYNQDPWPIPGKFCPNSHDSIHFQKANPQNSCCMHGLDQLRNPAWHHRCRCIHCRLPS